MKRIFLIVLIFCEIIITGVVYARNINQELSNTLLRMHIIANSNSQYDQAIKLEVRNRIIDIINEEKIKSKEDVKNEVLKIEKDILKFLEDEKTGYGGEVKIDNSKFPHKFYNGISLPCGDYSCIKVVLGEGRGENWWCIAYPPLCFTESVLGGLGDDANEKLKNMLSSEAFKIIENDDIEYKIKFQCVDWFYKISEKFM